MRNRSPNPAAAVVASVAVALALGHAAPAAAAAGDRATAGAAGATASAPSSEGRVDDAERWFKVDDVLLWTALVPQAGHLADHFGRGDFSIAAYGFPLLYAAVLAGGRYVFDAGPLYFAIADVALLSLFTATHIAPALIESPAKVHDKWQHAHDNALGVESPVAGVAAQLIIAAAPVTIAAHLGAQLVEGAERGFTWTRTPDAE